MRYSCLALDARLKCRRVMVALYSEVVDAGTQCAERCVKFSPWLKRNYMQSRLGPKSAS